jgi:aspartate aminotransferase
MRFSANTRDLKESATLAVAALARTMKEQGREVIDLSIGEPDFRTPDFAAQAGIAAIVQGFTHYTPVPGLLTLRQLIAEHLHHTHGRETESAGVVVTAGAKHALFNACFTLFGPGDRVLLPAPYWTSYPELIKLARAVPAIVAMHLEDGFKVTPGMLDRQYDESVRGLILNSPSNPTGAVYSLEELDAVVRWAADRDVWVISDEIYDRICYDEKRAPGILDLDPALFERAVLINGASKAFAMTGWRLGFSYSSPALAGKMADLQSHMTSNVATPTQYAAMAIYRSEPRVEHAVRAMVGVFRHRRERLVSLFRKHLPKVEFKPPAGAFYLFFRVDGFYHDEISDSITFCRWLLETTGVALVPGAAFGDDRFVRLSFAAPEDELVEAVRRMGEALAVEAVVG